MNQKLLGILRAVGCIFLFAGITGLISAIPDALNVFKDIPLVGALITPAIATTLTAIALGYEHQLADEWGYNLPA